MRTRTAPTSPQRSSCNARCASSAAASASPASSNAAQKPSPRTWNTCPRCAPMACCSSALWRTSAAFIAIRMLLHEARRPFDVGEEEGDGAAGQGVHGKSSLPLLSSPRHRHGGAATLPVIQCASRQSFPHSQVVATQRSSPVLPAILVEHAMSFAQRLNSLSPETLQALAPRHREGKPARAAGRQARDHAASGAAGLGADASAHHDGLQRVAAGAHHRRARQRARLPRRADRDPPGRLSRDRRRIALVRKHALRPAHRQFHSARPVRHVQRRAARSTSTAPASPIATAGGCRPSPASTTIFRCPGRSRTTRTSR